MTSAVFSSDLEITAPRPLAGADRARALRGRQCSVADLCARAGIRYRVTGGIVPLVAFWDGPGHGFTRTDEGDRLLVIDRSGLPQRREPRAARALEILAYGFNDYAARESVCGREIFVYPVGPEHGRAWLADIGKRGGSARSEVKRLTSRSNGKYGGARKGLQKP